MLWLEILVSVALGLFLSNAGEWVIHKYVLHGAGRKKGSFWNFHWGEHHRSVRQNEHIDPDYKRSPFGFHAQGKELLGLLSIMVLHIPVFWLFPFYAATVWACSLNYYRVHKRSHLDPAWAKQHLPWHYDHHMGPNQHANWCVTHPFFDWVMGTREPYHGTEREKKDQEKRAARASKVQDETQTEAEGLEEAAS